MPRYAPYTRRLLSLLMQRPLPLGHVYVPACGPGSCCRNTAPWHIVSPVTADHAARRGQAKLAGLAPVLSGFALEHAALLEHTCYAGHELVMLGEALPGRQLFGTDLAAGMVDLAEQKLAQAGLR